MNEELPLCGCGCGEPVTKLGNRFIQHHQNRGRIMGDKQKLQIAVTLTKPKPKPQLCECGCGEYAKPGDRFIYQHHLRGINYVSKKLTKKKRKPKPKPEPKLCDCGCGLYTLPGNDYIAGHQTRGKEPSLSHKKKISDSKKGMCGGEDNPNWKGGVSFDPYCKKFTNELKQQVRDLYNNCDFISGLPDYVCNVLNGKVWGLDIHHVDSNKMQGCEGISWKLVPLSRRNHMRMNGNRPFWEKLICYAIEYDKTYYNDELIDVWRIRWK